MPTVSSATFALFSWVQARLLEKANVTDAVALAGGANLPQPPAAVAFQGSASIAARSDHQHPIQKVPSYPVGARPDGAANLPWVVPIGRVAAWNPVSDVSAPLTPFPVREPLKITALHCWGARAADAGSVKVALFGSDVDGLPTGTPLWTSTAIVGTGGAGANYEWTALSVTIANPGIYWFAFGSYGFTTTRALPCLPTSTAVAEQYMTTSPGSPSWSPTLSLPSASFNATTGVFAAPTTLAYANDGSAWSYALQLAKP